MLFQCHWHVDYLYSMQTFSCNNNGQASAKQLSASVPAGTSITAYWRRVSSPHIGVFGNSYSHYLQPMDPRPRTRHGLHGQVLRILHFCQQCKSGLVQDRRNRYVHLESSCCSRSLISRACRSRLWYLANRRLGNWPS